jgi:hypothetical protein
MNFGLTQALREKIQDLEKVVMGLSMLLSARIASPERKV